MMTTLIFTVKSQDSPINNTSQAISCPSNVRDDNSWSIQKRNGLLTSYSICASFSEFRVGVRSTGGHTVVLPRYTCVSFLNYATTSQKRSWHVLQCNMRNKVLNMSPRSLSTDQWRRLVTRRIRFNMFRVMNMVLIYTARFHTVKD